MKHSMIAVFGRSITTARMISEVHIFHVLDDLHSAIVAKRSEARHSKGYASRQSITASLGRSDELFSGGIPARVKV